ncbi:MAG: hydroxymethylbilane synthase, partial [Chitinispirillaceae bacterium]|nr:hydroxymethylbilane synthase [Chitinispirillaceae bacterium]
MRSNVIVGTRGSKLALAQARIAAERLRRAYPEIEVTLQPIVTAGDRNQRASLAEIGGKGVFIREIERALCGGSIDIAVHSFKDITSRIPETLELCAFLAPESVCDTLVSRDGSPLAALPPGAIIGSGSMRRRALLSRMRPDLRFADIR